MKKKFVRLISAVLSAAMTLTAVPLSAFAEGEGHTHDGESNVITTPLDFREKTADENGVGWSWDHDTKTLTLDGVNIQATTDSMSVVTVPDGTEIVLNGENTIVQTDTGDSYTYVLSAVNTDTTNCDGTMTISGDGVLNAENRSTDSMARSLGGTIILNGGTVNATGKVVAKSLEIHNDGVLNANASATSYDGAAVNVGGSITVDGNGSLNAVGCAIENQDIMNTAILLNGNQDSKISVTGNGSITVPDSNGARYGICYDVDRRRINAEISGKVTAYGTMCGISGINLIMSGTGSVYATGDTLGIDNTDTAIDENEFVIKGSTEYKASESTVTSEVTLYGVYYKIDGEYAKTVVIKPDTSPRIILGKQTGIFKTEEYKLIEDMDMTDIKLKGTVYFDITLKNMSDEEFADARGYFGGDEPDLSASIIKTDYGWVCMVCDTEFSTTYDTDNTLTIKCGDIVSNTVQVKSNANRFNKVTQGDNTNRTVFYTNTSQEEKDNYKLVITYTVDSESISYNWYSTNSAYSADELGAAVSGSNGEFKLADNIPAGNYVLYCDITYSDGDSTETVTEKFTFTYKECAHENGYSDGKCTNCGALCDHSNIDIDTGKCKKCEHQYVATISTDGSAPTGYDTLKDCLDSITADSGNYVKIYQDIGDTSATATLDTIDVNHNVMIDLNGHKLNNIKLGVNKDVKLTLTGTEGSYVTQVYVRNGGSFVIDSDANAEFNTIFVEAGAGLAVNDGAKVTTEQLTVIASVADDGTTTTSVKLATGMKLGALSYYCQNNSGVVKLGNLLDVTRQALQYDESGEYLDLYKEYGAMSYPFALTVVEHTDADHKYGTGTGKCKECGKPCEHSGDINTDNGICSICGAVVSVAIYTDANGISKYVDADELHSLLNEYNGSGTIKLFKDYSKPSAQYDLYGELTIDLNGRQFNIRSITPCKNGKLTIKNSGNPVMLGCNVYPTSDPSYAGGTLIIDGDVVLDTSIYVYDSSTVILKDGTYTAGLYARDSKTLYDMLGEGKAFFKADGTLFNASVKEISSDVTLIVKDHSHTYVDGKCDCGYICPHSDVDSETGKCTECEYQYAAVIVKDGAVASVHEENEMVAAFEAADSDANTGCTLRVYKNYTGSYTTLSGKFTLWIAEKVNVGTLTVSGDITVTGSKINNSFYGNFDVAAGGKLTFDENCVAMGTVSVGAGTFDCYCSLGTTLNINDASSDVILHGGYFIKIRYNGGGDRANAEILTLLAENRMFMTRSNDPIDGSKTLLKDGFATTVLVIPHEDHGYDSTTGKCTICGKRCGHTDVDSKTGVCPTCKYQLTAGISGVGTAKYFDNIGDAFTAALSAENNGCTLTLYKDCELSQNIVIGNATVTVDMNGHSILLAYRIKVNDGGVLYLKNSGENGSIETEIDVNKGGTLINGTADDSRSAVSVFGVTADAAKRVEIYGGSYEGLTVNNGTSGIALYGGSYESINTNDLTDSTPVSALLAKGYAFATLNSVTHLPESIVDGSETNLNPGLENVMVVAHTHTYTETNTKCACGVCALAIFTETTQSEVTYTFIESATQFKNIAENEADGVLKLTGDVDCIVKGIIINGNKTIDMNGHTLNVSVGTEEISAVAVYGNVTFENSGSKRAVINATGVYSHGMVTVNGDIEFGAFATFEDGDALINAGVFKSIYVQGRSVIEILGSGKALASESGEILNASVQQIYKAGNNIFVKAHPKHTYDDHCNCACGYKCLHDGEGQVNEDSANKVCSECGAKIYAKVTTADGKVKYFDDITEGLRYADKAENKGCVFTLVTTGGLENDITLSSGQFTITAIDDNYINAYTRKINIKGAEITVENCAFNCFVGLYSGSLTYPEGSTSVCINGISVFGGTLNISDGVSENFGANKFTISDTATDAKVTIGGGIYSEIKLGQYTFKDILASGTRLISVEYSQETDEIIATNELLYSIVSEQNTLGVDDDKDYRFVKCDHKNDDGSYAFNEGGICKYCNSEFAASVSYTDGSEKTELVGDIYDAFDKANEMGTATVTLYKNIENNITDTIAVTGNVTLELNGKKLTTPGFEPYYAIEVKSGKLTVNGSGSIKRAVVRNGGDAEINGGTFSDFRIEDGGNAVINGGQFYSIKVSGEGRNVGQLLADGYAYKSLDGYWSTIAEREKQGIASVNVLEAPIKSASIAWADGETPVVYRNGDKYLYVNITYELAVGSRGATYSDFVNGNNRIKDYNLYNKYMVHCYEIGKLAAKDGEVEYYTVLKCNGYEYKSNVLKLTLATCSHPEDSFLYENNGLVICGICDALIEAEVVDADGKSLGYADIESAIKLAQENEGSTVKLMSDGVSSATESTTVTGGRFTVDFNGKEVYYQFAVNGGDVTFTSSVKQADVENLISEITVNGTDAKVTIDGKIKLGRVRIISGTLTVNSTDGYIKGLSINGGKADIDGAEIDTLVFKGGDLAIRNVTVGSLDINKKATDATEHNIVIESGSFDTITCSDDSDYNIVKALASERRLRGTESGIIYEYSEIESLTEATDITVEKCDHKYANGNIAVDDDYVCYYCNSQIIATVSYTADGSEKTELFSDIYDAFAKANEIGTATVTLYKNIENSEFTREITVTGNVTLNLNGKTLGATDKANKINICGSTLTVNGNGKVWSAIEAKADSKLTITNGEYYDVCALSDSEVVILDGIIDCLSVYGTGKPEVSGGKFKYLFMYNGKAIESVLADGYAYKNADGTWLSIDEREKDSYLGGSKGALSVEKAPIESASIAWDGEETLVVYRNGEKNLDVNVTYDVADTSKDITYSDFVNGNNYRKDSTIYDNWYAVFGHEIGEIIAEDGEVEYYTVLKCDGYEYKSNALKFTLATCSHPEDSFTEKNNDGSVYCGICDLLIGAQVIKADGEPLGYADMDTAIKLAQENEGSTVKLISDKVPDISTYTVTGGRFTVDFNGKEVYYRFDVNGGDVTFTSSVKQADVQNLRSKINVNGTDAKVTIDGKIKLGSVTLSSGTLKINSTDGYIGGLSINGGKANIDGADVDTIAINGGDTVIKNVYAGSISMNAGTTDGSGYNVSIVSGRFGSFYCDADSGYNIGKVMASGSSVREEGEPCYYDSVQNRTEGIDLDFAVCDHKNNMGRPNLNDANVCNYCNSQIVATVSYKVVTSEEIALFTDIYDAFDWANKRGTATITLYKDIENSELTQEITVTGNVTLALNGKKLGDSYDGKYIQSSDGGELTVNGDGKIAKTVRAKKNSKLTINSGEFDWVIIDEGGDAVISGGSIAAVNINGNAELSGGKFYIIAVYGTLESMLADGYAYKIDGGAWLSIADRARSGYSNVDHEHKPVTVEKAPIKSATITAEDESPIIYRNGNNSVDYTANVTYTGNETLYVTRCLIDGTVIREKTIFNGHCELCSGEVDKVVAEDGEIQYYCIFTYDGYDYKSNAVTLTVATCQHPVESVKCDDNGNYVCGICDSTLLASVEMSDGTLSYYDNLNDAIGAAQESEGCTLKLVSRDQTGDTVRISGGKFTVDLAGVPALYEFEITGGDVTFKSSEEFSSEYSDRCYITVNGSDAKVTIDGKIELETEQLSDGTFTTNSTEAYIEELSIWDGKATVDGAYIRTIMIYGGNTVIKDVISNLMKMRGSWYDNTSIVSGRFGFVACNGYALYKAIASGSRVTGFDMNVGLYKYADIQKKTEIANIIVEKCNHKDANGSYVLDGNPCPYCNEEIVATVSYTADGSEQTDLFSDIYDAFERANEAGTATITLYKKIADSELTRDVNVTGNVTLELNGKKLGYSFVSLTVEVSDGGMLTVDGDGKMAMPIIVNENAKLTVNGGEIATVMIYKDGNAEISGGFIEDMGVKGNVKLSGGKFYNIEIANGSLESVLADGYAYRKDGGEWLSIAERAEKEYDSSDNDNQAVNVEEAPIKSATLSTKINKLYRNSNANPTLKFNLTIAHGPNLTDSDVRMRYGINSYESGEIIFSSLSSLVKNAELRANEIIDKAGNSDAAKIYFVVTTGDGYEIKSNTVSIDLVDCDHSQVVDPTADKEIAGNITEPTYCEICESKFNAKITKGDDVKYYDDLDEAAKDAQKSENEGCTLYPLYNKKGYVGQFVITEGNFTLKYAVRTAFANPVVIKGNAKLKVTGRCAVTESENQDAFTVYDGDVTFDGLATGSNVTINGGNVTMAGNNINCLTINGGNVSISSGGFAEIVTTVSDKVIADYIDPGFWVQDRGTKEWIDIYSLDKATASSTNVLSVRLCPMQIIKPIDTVYYTNGYYPEGIPSLQINAEPWYSNEVDAKVAYQWIAIDENGNETEIEGATGRKLSLENLTTGRYYCRLTYSNAATAGVSMKSDIVTATITECEHSGGEATCTNKAKCEICGAEYGEMKPHNYAHIKAPEYLKSAATCTAKAVYYTSCTECGLSSKGTADEATFEYGNALGHSFGEWSSTAPTCTEDGSRVRKCSRCDKIETEVIPATGHKYVDTVIKPTYTEKGYTLHKCSRCGSSYKDSYTNVLVLAKISGLKTVSRTDTTAKISWNKNPNADGYIIEQYNGSRWMLIARITSNSTVSFTAKTLVAGSTNKLRARAYKGTVYSAYTYININTAPSAITGFTLKNATSSTLNVAWDRNTSGDGYILDKYDGSKWVTVAKVTNHATLNNTANNLKAGTSYKFRIRAYKVFGSVTVYGSYTYLTAGTKPAAMSGIKVKSKTNLTASLQWNKNISADGYVLDKYDGSKWVTIKTLTSNTDTSFNVTGLKASTTFKFRLRAYKNYGTAKEYSEFTYFTVNTRPYTTTGMKCNSKTNLTANLQWNKNISADGYVLDKYDGTKWVTIKTFTSNANTSFNVTGLKASTTFKFRLRAYKNFGSAKEYSAYTYLNVNTRPYTTTGFKMKSATKNSVTLQWNKNISANGYCIEKWDGSKWVQVKRYTSNANVTYTATGLKADTAYKFRIRAYKTIGNVNEYSAYSAVVTARTKK